MKINKKINKKTKINKKIKIKKKLFRIIKNIISMNYLHT